MASTIDSHERFHGVRVECRSIDVAGRSLSLLIPAEPYALLTDPEVVARFEQNEYMPYWAELWPAAVLLADEVAAWEPQEDRRSAPSVLELGCGLGLGGLIACGRGYRVTLSDYDDSALAFARENARRNGLPEPGTRWIDWNLDYPELRFDRIIGADILYEARNLEPVAAFVSRHLVAGGMALIADAVRPSADPFEKVAGDHGLNVGVELIERPFPSCTSRINRPVREAGETLRGRLFHLGLPSR